MPNCVLHRGANNGKMASSLRALVASLLLVVVLVLPESTCAHGSTGHAAGRKTYAASHRAQHHRPRFQPGPWKKAHATFYEGGSGTFGGACGYQDVVQQGYGLQTAALSTVLFNNGLTCGACYEIKCMDDPQWCKPGSLIVTAANLCPPNFYLPSDNGGWCNPPREHFDIAKPVFTQLATDYTPGIIPVQYRRVPCQKKGGIRFTITGNPYFNQVLISNVGGAGDVISVQVKGNKLPWTTMKRVWGQKWETDAMLVGQSLTFRVRASDSRFSTSWHVAPANWQFGQTFEGKNFR